MDLKVCSTPLTFFLLLEVFDYVPLKQRPTQRLVCSRWRTAYWGRMERVTMCAVVPLFHVSAMLICLREVVVQCCLTDPPLSEGPFSAPQRLVLNCKHSIPVGALEHIFHMELVQSIDASYPSSISDAHLCHCTSLRELNASGNPNIRSTAVFAATLRKLIAVFNCGIGDAGLVSAIHLEELDASLNPKITTTSPFAQTLRRLIACPWDCGINDAGLTSAVYLEELDARSNYKITTTIPFSTTLRKLNARGPCGISDAGLTSAVHLEELDASDNHKITTTAPFAATLRTLHARGACGIGDAGLVCAVRLEQFHSQENLKITLLAPFAATHIKQTT